MSRRLRDYVRLRMDYYEDDVLLAAADECATAMHLWPILIAKAKEASHYKDNPNGVVRTTVAKLARDAYVAVADVRPALDALTDGDLIMFAASGQNRVEISLNQFGKWQNARGNNADRQDTSRANTCRDFDAASHTSVTGESHTSNPEREIEREEEKGPKGPMSENAAALSERAANIQNVFDYWAKVERETGGLGSAGRGRPPKLTKERRAKINARLADGYSVADLKMAVAFYARDPFHSGDKDGTRHTDLTTTLKNGAKVEAGVAGYGDRGVAKLGSMYDSLRKHGIGEPAA